MKKERNVLLALLLIFVCGMAFLVFAMFGGVFRAPIAVQSNGEEIKPYGNRLSLSVSSNQKQYESECEWLQDAEIKQAIPELTYADDFSIKGKNADEFSYVMNVYNPRGKCVQKEIELSMLPELQAGIYYIGIVRQDKNGEYVEEPALFQKEICEYVFKMKKPSNAAEGEPHVTVFSNGEEIRPFSEALSSSRWAPTGGWDAAKLIQRWPRDKSVVSEFPVVTYAEDFEIRVRDDTSLYGTFKIYKSVDSMVAEVGTQSYFATLPAGTYYVCFNISYHSGDWMVSKHGDEGYEYSGSSQCLFTLIKEDEKEETEKNEKEDGDAVSREVPIVSQNGKQIPITHSYFLHASSYSNGYWIAADGAPFGYAFAGKENTLIEIEYSDDINILYEDETVSYSKINVYDNEMKSYDRGVSVKNLGALPAGTYYIGIMISHQGRYIDDGKYPGYESSTSEYVFKLLKPVAEKEEPPVSEIYDPNANADVEPDVEPVVEPDIQPDIEPEPDPDTETIERSNTIAFSAPMYLYSYEELEQAIADAYSGSKSYDYQKLEHYHVPTYASKWCELSQIYSGNPMSYTVRYSMKEEFGERNSYAEPWDLTMTITVDEKAAIENFQFFTTQASFKPYEACEGVYY
ncbi:MAG: hypothetical protein IJP33_01405, partial [Firmicutes bacterium]|nr:hypothetical protein [Bacillota bacterium]